MVKDRKFAVVIAVILILVGVISFFVLSKSLSDPETFKGTIQALDEKKNTVAKLSAISIAAASVIDLIPGDAGKSISDALINLGGYFVILFAAIYLEKILLSMSGFVAFKVMIPIGLFLLAGFMLLKNDYLKRLGAKLISIGLVLFLLVPSSVWVSGVVDKTHDLSKQQAIQEIGEDTNLLESESEETVASDTAEETAEEETSLLGKIMQSGSSVLGKVKDGGMTALASAKEVPKKMSSLLDNLIEEIAYFFVSICAIPIVVLLVLVVFLKQVLGFKNSGAGDYTALIKELRKAAPGTKEAEE